MEYRRVKNDRWKNVQCAVKNAIYKYYRKDKESFKTKNKHIGESKVFIYDQYYISDENDALNMVTVTPASYLRVNVNVIIRELQSMFTNKMSEKYFQVDTTDTYEKTLKVSENSEIVDLYMIAKLYGNIQEKTFGEKIKEMTIMELNWGDEKIPVVLDYLFKDPDESTYGLFENYLRNLKDTFCPYKSIQWLISQLLNIPMLDTDASSNDITTYNLEKYILTAVNRMTRRLPEFGHHIDDYYDIVQFFFDQLSNAGLNMTYVYANPDFTKIFASKDAFNLKQMERIRSSAYTAMNLSRDLCNIVNYVIKMNACKTEEITTEEQRKFQLSYYVLGKFGIGLDIVRTASYEDGFVSYISIPDAKVKNSDFVVSPPYNIDRMVDSYENLLTLLRRMEQFDMFWISVFKNEDESKRRIELLNQVSFLALMKSYISMSEYIANNDFKEAAYPYLIYDRDEITLGIVFEAFRLYYKNRKDPFMTLPYVASPVTLSNMIHRSYIHYGNECNRFAKVFSIEDVPYVQSEDPRVEMNAKAVTKFEWIMLFLYRSCISYATNGLLSVDGAHYRYRFVKNADTQPIDQMDRLVEIRYGTEDNRKGDRPILNGSVRCHIQSKMSDSACDTIKEDVFEYASKFKNFETACYNISYYTTEGYRLSQQIDGIIGEITGAPVDMESAMWVFRMLRK